MTKRQQEVNKFIKDTNRIINLLTEWQIKKKEGKKITEIEVSNKWREFSLLWHKAKGEAICNEEIVKLQYEAVIRSFGFFKDTVKIFKNLPEY